jgi:AcrR family transcriptional regulator
MSDLREQVLAASLALIEEDGVAALSLREVARRAGVSHQAPYHHFGHKEAIVAELVARGFTRLAERLEAAEQSRGTPSRRLMLAGQAYVAFALAEPGSFRIMFRSELVDRAAFPAAGEAGARAYAPLVRLVNECHAGPRTPRAGSAAAEKLEALVTMHWSLVHGLATLLLDGSLGRRFATREARDAHIEATLAVFTRATASLVR